MGKNDDVKDKLDNTSSKDDPISLSEVEKLAHDRLPKAVYDYYACGADDQDALKRNIDAYSRIYILPRVLRDVSTVDTTTKIFDWTTSIPIAFAPSAMQKLAGGDGELDVGRTAAKLGLNMTLSSQSTTSLEDVMDAAKREAAIGDCSPKFWFQIYLTPDMDHNIALITRAEGIINPSEIKSRIMLIELPIIAAGYEALAITVDTPVLGNRLNERKTPLVLPKHLRLPNVEDISKPKSNKPTVNRLLMDARTAKQAEEILDRARNTTHSSALTWDVVATLRKSTTMKIILKGIMTPEDARLAVKHGVDAIVVSNHGGRQLDCVPSTLEALPDIAAAVEHRIPVIFDGGIRKGADVFKAIALGADLVLIGRPVVWGLGYKGQEGLETVVNILERELSRTMALAGVTKVADIKAGSLGIARSSFGFSRL
ncbi:hydroxyacid oxidase [Hyphodiscus hymeniophilus]|uniref:Hydroxyacid oxidase n=1 Tax=Hyphodiscus hymeniophilus TaxID=353542 RepID=A0A9P6VE57_9HELO|nr:hydroxyacid oxidase [Hyphodiscus hymeniophilus]